MNYQRAIGGGLLLIATATASASGQMAPRLGIYAGGMMLRVQSEVAGRVESMTDQVLVGEAVYTRGFLLAEGLYAQGRLTPAGGAPRDLVEARGFAGVRIFRMLSIKGGPQIRAVALPSGTRRRIFWEVRTRIEAPIAGIVGAYAEGWTAMAGRSNIDEHVDKAHGAEAAVTARVPGLPVWGKLGYRVEFAGFDQGLRSETVDGITLSIGVGLR
ncbi:MAG: hypothetical protein HY700_21465 [Gemmatimonadetes bacterium]|nr:hypothetical protein [Gemmatimonadota bacterium]